MTALIWDADGQRFYETGVDHGVLYIPTAGVYDVGYAWNGLVSVTEAPSGAEPNRQYADNIAYLTLLSREEFGCTIEAFTYPDAFATCDGTAELTPGVLIGQQARSTFGLSYRTRIGNDTDGDMLGYKLHLVYGATAAPSERAYQTINDSPEALTFSWEVTTTPVAVGTIGGTEYKPTSTLVIDSTKVNATALGTLETLLYGSVGTDPSLPSPATVYSLFSGTVTTATPTAPTFAANVITIPTVTGVTYYINNVAVTGDITITANTIVVARPNAGYKFPPVIDDDWMFTYSA